jgi:hypothetical protein
VFGRQRLREKQSASLESPLLVEGVRFLEVKGGVELQPSASHARGELLDPLHQQRGDPPTAVIPIDDQLVDVSNGTLLPQVDLPSDFCESFEVLAAAR